MAGGGWKAEWELLLVVVHVRLFLADAVIVEKRDAATRGISGFHCACLCCVCELVEEGGGKAKRRRVQGALSYEASGFKKRMGRRLVGWTAGGGDRLELRAGRCNVSRQKCCYRE